MERRKSAGDYKGCLKMSNRTDCWEEADWIIHCYISVWCHLPPEGDEDGWIEGESLHMNEDLNPEQVIGVEWKEITKP